MFEAWKYALIFLTILSFPLFSVGQIVNEKRVEFELSEGFQVKHAIEFGELGLVLLSKSDQQSDGLSEWRIEGHDTALVATHSATFRIPKNLYLDELYHTESSIHLLFKNKRGEYQIHSFDVRSLSHQKISGRVPRKTSMFAMKVLGNTAFFDAMIRGTSFVYTVDLTSGIQRPIPLDIPGYRRGNASVESMEVLSSTQEVLVYVDAYASKQHDKFVFKFDNQGMKLGSLKLSQTTENALSSSSATYLGNDQYMHVGTYSNFSAQSAQGLYITMLEGEKTAFIKFHNFLDFNNFLNYLPSDQVERIERKRERKNARGKSFNLNYLIYAHDIQRLDTNFVFIGEAYIPTYRMETEYAYDLNGNPVLRSKRVFDGYDYTHAIVSCFDPSGEMVWDNTFKMSLGYKPMIRRKFITEQVDSTGIRLLYVDDETIKSRAYQKNGTVQEGPGYKKINSKLPADEIKATNSHIHHWYGDTFIAHGVQRIKNEDAKFGQKRRTVFFIHKVTFTRAHPE